MMRPRAEIPVATKNAIVKPKIGLIPTIWFRPVLDVNRKSVSWKWMGTQKKLRKVRGAMKLIVTLVELAGLEEDGAEGTIVEKRELECEEGD